MQHQGQSKVNGVLSRLDERQAVKASLASSTELALGRDGLLTTKRCGGSFATKWKGGYVGSLATTKGGCDCSLATKRKGGYVGSFATKGRKGE